MVKFQDDFYADVRIEDRSRTTISYKAGILEEMKTRVERRAFLRVYDGRMWYYASVTDLAHLQKTLDGLYAAATPGGHFASPVQMSYLMENGKLIGRLPDLNISGNFYDLLGKDYIGAACDDPLPGSMLCAVTMDLAK